MCYKTRTIYIHNREWGPCQQLRDREAWCLGRPGTSGKRLPVRLPWMFCTGCSRSPRVGDLSARPSGIVLWDNRQRGPPQGAVCGRALDRYVHGEEHCPVECQYDLLLRTVLTSTLCQTDFTHKKLCLRKLSEEHWETELRKFLASLVTYTKSSFRLSECKWATGWPASYHRPIWTQPWVCATRCGTSLPRCRWSLFGQTPGRVLQHWCTEARASGHKSKRKAQGSDLVDSPLGGAVLRGACRGHVERLCLPFQPGSLVGQHQAAPAGADDFRNELFAVYTDLHCTPILHELFGELEFFIWFVHRLRFWGKPGDTSKWPMVTSGGFFWPCTTFPPLQGRRSQREDR